MRLLSAVVRPHRRLRESRWHPDEHTVPSALPDDPATLQLILRAALAEIERLQLQRAGLRRDRFGRRSEQLDDATLQQREENLEQSVAKQQAGLDALLPLADARPPEPDAAPDAPRAKTAKRNRGALSADLPRVEVIVDIDDKACPCCEPGCNPASRPGPRR